jgi:hypothetical protein
MPIKSNEFTPLPLPNFENFQSWSPWPEVHWWTLLIVYILILRSKYYLFVFKCIHNYKGVPNIWKNIFKTNGTRNGLMLETPKTRIKICDKNFFINAMKLFHSLSKIVRNETEFSLYLKNVKIFLKKNIVFKWYVFVFTYALWMNKLYFYYLLLLFSIKINQISYL